MIRLLQSVRLPSLLLGTLVVGGCSWTFGSGQGEPPEMHKNLSRTFDIQTGVVEGDLDRAQRAAAWLLTRDGQAVLPPEFEIYRREMVGYASAVTEARDLGSVAALAGQLAAACGSCHQALERGPRFVPGQALPGGDTRASQMIRHLWAADRMWEGLVGPSERSWQAGVAALAESGPALSEVLQASTPAGKSAGLTWELQVLAETARKAVNRRERAEVYGTMLATCTRCHEAIGLMVEM